MSARSRLVLAALLLSPAAATGDRSLRLSAPLPHIPVFAASRPEFTSDLEFLVYLATTEGADVGLYSAGLNGARVRLDDLAPGQSVASFTLDPTGERVVFLTTDVVGRELYSAPTDGSAPAVRLHAPILTGRDVTSFQISPDGAWVVYRSDVLVNGRFVLASVPIAGGTPVEVNGPLVVAGDVREIYRISPDSTTVVYSANQEVAEFEIYAAPIQGGGPSRNLGIERNSNSTFALKFSGDGARVVHLNGARNAIFSVPLDASAAPVMLSNPAIFGVSDFLPTPDGARVVILSLFGALYVSPTDGSAPPATLATLHAPSGSRVTDVVLSPDGAWAVFRGDLATDEVFELFAVPVDGSVPAFRLNPALAPDEDVGGDFQLADDGSGVAFVAGGRLYVHGLDPLDTPLELDSGVGAGDLPLALGSDSARVFYAKQAPAGVRLMSAALDGSTLPLVLGGGYTGVTSVRPRPDAAFVAYTADQELRGEIELFVSPSATPGASTQISVEPSATTLAGEVFSHQPAPGGRVLFTARQESPNYVGLYTVRTAGGDLRRLSGRSAPVPVLPQGRVALGAGYAVFQGARALDAGFEPAGLYAVALDGSAEPFALHAPLPEDGAVLDFVLSSDGTQVFFRGDLAGDDQFHLYRAPIDGSAAPVQLTASLLDGRDVQDEYRAASASVVVYRVDTAGVRELYAADGAGPPRKLHPALGAGQTVDRFELSPDGTRAVYLVHLGPASIGDDLLSVPVDGSSAPVKLSGTLVQGELDEFHIAADGATVAFLVWRGSSVGFHLYRAPIDGRSPPVRLDLPAIARVQRGFALDPSGQRVLYRVDPSSTAPTDLYSVPLDGSAPPVRLNDVNGDDVRPLVQTTSALPGFQFSADGTRVVYLQGTQLFAVPSDRSAPPLLLNGPDSPASGFLLDPTGSRVAYLGDAPDPVLESVYVVPIDRGREPLLVGPSTSAGGDARDDLVFAADGGALFHRFAHADGLHPELFATLLARQTRSAPPPRTR